MSKSRHTEAQIITALKQVEAGRTADAVAREQGMRGVAPVPGKPLRTTMRVPRVPRLWGPGWKALPPIRLSKFFHFARESGRAEQKSSKIVCQGRPIQSII
jgi:hypothetical protein